MNDALTNNNEVCPRCYVGRIRAVKVVLSRVIAGQVLSVPNFPAWECDVCHAFMYDPKAIIELRRLLSDQVPMPKPRLSKKSDPSSPKKNLKSPSIS